MKKLAALLVFLCAALVIALVSCTQNHRRLGWCGTTTIELPAGTKLVSATWKGTQEIWYLYRPAREGEKPETSTMQEASAYGNLQGKVIFKEK